MPLRPAVVLLVALAALSMTACKTPPHVVRLAPPPTLMAPHPEPHLRGNTNEYMVEALAECRTQIRLCNAHKQQLRNLYEFTE